MSDTDFRLWVEKHGGWFLIWTFGLLPLVWWTINDISVKDLSDSYGVFSAIGRATGIVGLVLYAINLLLAARTRWMEGFFGGLNRVYIAHHITGGIALILLVFHPLFLAVKVITFTDLTTLREAALYLLPRLIPKDATLMDFQQASSINAGIVAFTGMVSLLILTFFVKLPYRLWLFTHKFLGVAFMFVGLHVVFISSDISTDIFLKIYMLFWICVGIGAFIYRTVMSNVFVRRAPYKVLEVRELDGNVTSLTMDAIEKPIDYKPGQFIFIRFLFSDTEGVISETHPFSIASSPKEHKLRILVKSLGDYTSSLKKLKVGSIAEIEGAYGKFTFTRFGNRPQVWIAGGIGVTPFLSMARSYDEMSPSVDLIYSVVHRTELLDQAALAQAIPAAFQTFRYFPYVADEQSGFLSIDKVESICGDLKGREIFICGPPPMMKSLRSQLREKGIPESRIHSEEFSMS